MSIWFQLKVTTKSVLSNITRLIQNYKYSIKYMFRALVFGVGALLGLISAAELPPYRLPGDVIPQHYILSLHTDLDKFTFDGKVTIEIECKRATETIKIHSKELTITDNDVTLEEIDEKGNNKVKGFHLDTSNDFLVIDLTESLVARSKYILTIVFKGTLNTGLAGYYRSSYTDMSTNTKKWLAVTQFEPTDARRAFPCFDEPDMKANFTIHLGHKSHLNSLSNMPLNFRHSIDEWVWDEYQTSVPMSTYLVAFMVSEFVPRESDPEPNKVLFTVWARKDAIDQLEFSRKFGPKILSFYEDFFDIMYPLPKLDMAAIPDFSAGAMENWGLITFRESSLLVDESTTSVLKQYYIANTIAHELAHQWFGNLVTMKWWTDLWLNEGFAEYIATVAVNNQFPNWNTYNNEVISNLISLFLWDGLHSSHPVSVPIGHPDEINQIFDTISYCKGSQLLHIMNSFLGNNVFKSGIRDYLKKFQYSNSEQDDLWGCLTKAAEGTAALPEGVTVKQVMDKWTLQTGYPVVNVKREGGSLTVSQKRFLSDPLKGGDKVEGCWWIHLTYSTAKQTQGSLWFDCEKTELMFDTGAGADDWVLLNNKATGMYRVNYDPHTWTLLADVLHGPDFTVINELNRALLVLDALVLAQVGELDYTTAFRVLKYIRKENSYIPWMAAIAELDNLQIILWRTEKFNDFKKLMQSLLAEIYVRFSDLNSVPDGVEEVKHKFLITKLACQYELADCEQKAVDLFNLWKSSNTNPIPKELHGIVYCVGVRKGGEEDWQFVWNKYLSSNIASERESLLLALPCTQRQEPLERLLKWSIDGKSGIRRQDSYAVFAFVAMKTQEGYKQALKFMETNAQQIHDYMGTSFKHLGDYVRILANRMVFTEEVDKMKQFVKDHNKLLEKSQMSVNQGLENADQNLAWMAKYYDSISDAFAA